MPKSWRVRVRSSSSFSASVLDAAFAAVNASLPVALMIVFFSPSSYSLIHFAAALERRWEHNSTLRASSIFLDFRTTSPRRVGLTPPTEYSCDQDASSLSVSLVLTYKTISLQ
jgi:hypothetical protein